MSHFFLCYESCSTRCFFFCLSWCLGFCSNIILFEISIIICRVLSHCIICTSNLVKLQKAMDNIKTVLQSERFSSSARLHPLPAVKGPCEAPPAGDAGPASPQLRHRGHSTV